VLALRKLRKVLLFNGFLRTRDLWRGRGNGDATIYNVQSGSLSEGQIKEMKTQCQTSQIHSSLAGDEDLAELVEVFVGEIPNRIEALNGAAEQKDWKSVERFAHQLKGALGSYGFGTVMPFAQDLETMTREGKPETEIVAALKQLESMCERIHSGSCCE